MPSLTRFQTHTLHGRDDECRLLERVLARVSATGATEVVMIRGGGGVGKSTVARWLLRQAQRAASPIGEGKCDQLSADIPFAAMSHIVRALVLDALGGEQAALDRLARHWRELLSGHANSITELVPEAQHILGAPGPAPSVLAAQGNARIELALIRTLEAFARLGKPAVVFLDDLQWADEATLSFLRAFILNPPSNVLFIGAYRDNDPAFPQWYARVKHASRSALAQSNDVSVAPLSVAAFQRIVDDALRQPGEKTGELARVLHGKSGGNPYFAQQLLQSWIDDGLLVRAAGGWEWGIAAIDAAGHADHVVDLIIHRISRLPAAQKLVLERLSCIGMECASDLLAFVCEIEPGAFARTSAQLAVANLVLCQGARCAFQHDRVLEAAYALIAPEARSRAHAHNARRMIAYRGGGEACAAYDIGNQIEKVAPADVALDERPAFVRVLLDAARRAQRASAAERAYAYLASAKALMNEEWWETGFALAYEAAIIECECLIARAELAQATACIAAMLERDLLPGDRAPLHRLEAVLHTLRSDYDRAIDAALAGLAILGIDLARMPDADELRASCDSVLDTLRGRPIASLADLPPCADAAMREAMALLSTLISSLFVTGDIRFTHLAKLVELTLRHGISPDSPYGLAWFGVMIASYYGKYEEGYAFGRAALEVVERHSFESSRVATLVALDQVAVWTQPLAHALEYAQEASTRGMLSGDLGMACYACNHVVSDMLAMGTGLPLVEETAEHGIALTRSIGYVDIELLIQAQLDFVTVMVKGIAPGDVDAWIAACNARADGATSLPTKFWVWLYAGLASAFQQRWADAATFLAHALEFVSTAPAHINVADCHLYHALAVARASRRDHAATRALLAHECRRFDNWATHNPRTFRNKLHLLQGELARVDGAPLDALRYFDDAACTASDAGLVHEEAFAHELAAIVCRDHGLRTGETRHAGLARAAYLRWGARHQADAIRLAQPVQAPESGPPVSQDDSAALQFGLKAAQALSQEAVKEKLVETMFADLLAQASAQYGVLIRVADGAPLIEASGRLTADGIVTSVAVVAPDPAIVPMRLLTMVLRTQRPVVIHDAQEEVSSVRSAEGVSGALRSVLCLPLMRGGALAGLLYLENNLAPGVFHPARVQHLELMASQIAIALEFARLYEQLIDANQARTEAERHLHVARAELVRNVHTTVLASLAASIAHEINQPLGAIVTSAEAALRWLDRDTPDLERTRSGLQRIRTDGRRAADIIRALRGLAGNRAATLAHIDVADLILGVVDMLADELRAKGIEKTLQVGSGLVVMGDRVQLQQVILNLLNNAVDAMAGGAADVHRHLEVTARLASGAVEVVVADSGHGIAQDKLRHIFEPFFTTKDSGLGMGLSICASIAEAHGGVLRGDNNPAGGAIFTLRIPRDPPDRG